MKMNKDIKKQWIDALESDEYPQTTGRLNTMAGFCCLGVLTDLYIKAHPDGDGWTLAADCDVRTFKRDGATLHPDVREWSGIETQTGEYRQDFGADSLSEDNDNGQNFHQIAATIERNF